MYICNRNWIGVFSYFKRANSYNTGSCFWSIIAILNFRLLAIAIEKSMELSPGRAQIFTGMRFLIRMFIVAVVVFVSVKNPNINVIGTIFGLTSTQIVIFIKKLIISKIWRKEA